MTIETMDATAENLKKDMTVRYKDPSKLIKAFQDKYRDRDGIVEWIGPDEHGQFKGKANVRFLKRNGRGKEFKATLSIRELIIVVGAESARTE